MTGLHIYVWMCDYQWKVNAIHKWLTKAVEAGGFLIEVFVDSRKNRVAIYGRTTAS